MLFAKLRNKHQSFLYWRNTKNIRKSERRKCNGTRMRDTQTYTITNEYRIRAIIGTVKGKVVNIIGDMICGSRIQELRLPRGSVCGGAVSSRWGTEETFCMWALFCTTTLLVIKLTNTSVTTSLIVFTIGLLVRILLRRRKLMRSWPWVLRMKLMWWNNFASRWPSGLMPMIWIISRSSIGRQN